MFEEVVGPLQPILAEMPQDLPPPGPAVSLSSPRLALDEAAREQPRVAISALEDCVRDDMVDVPPPTRRVTPSPNSSSRRGASAIPHLVYDHRDARAGGRRDDRWNGSCLAVTWAESPGHLGVGPTEEVLLTFSAKLIDTSPLVGEEHDRVLGGKEEYAAPPG